MIKFVFENEENTIDDGFELVKKDNLLNKILQDILMDYTVDKGFKTNFVADVLKTKYNAEILYIDDLEETKEEENLVY